jgi:hypothetical protein
MLFLFALGTLRVVACGEEDTSCVDDEDCDDGNPCTRDWCHSYDPDAPITCEVVQRCRNWPEADGTSCGSGKVCADGECVALPTDACTNAEDLAVVCDLGFADEVETCARDGIGDPGATAPCLVENTGVSADCASCYGALVNCIFENCVHVCGPEPNSQACDDCQAEYGCDTLLADCTGDLASACDTGGTMFDVGAFEVQP